MKIMRNCRNCGEKFEVNDNRKKCCSNKCTQKFWNKTHRDMRNKYSRKSYAKRVVQK